MRQNNTQPLEYAPLRLAFKPGALIGQRIQIHGAPFGLEPQDAAAIVKAAGAAVVTDQERPTMLITSDPNATDAALAHARAEGVPVIHDALLLIWVNGRVHLDVLKQKVGSGILNRQMANMHVVLSPDMWPDRHDLVQLVRLYSLRGATVILSEWPNDFPYAIAVVPANPHINNVLRGADDTQAAIAVSDLNDALLEIPGTISGVKLAGFRYRPRPLALDETVGAADVRFSVQF